MQITVRTHHVNITPALKAYAHTKLSRLEKFFENIQGILIELDFSETSNENTRQESKGTIWASQTIIRATECTKDMYASIDGLVDKLEKQLKKHKEKLKSHKVERRKRNFDTLNNSTSSDHTTAIKAAISEPRFIPKPMTPEDAAILLEDNHYDFLVFRNSESNQINVIYPDKRGDLSLIETH